MVLASKVRRRGELAPRYVREIVWRITIEQQCKEKETKTVVRKAQFVVSGKLFVFVSLPITNSRWVARREESHPETGRDLNPSSALLCI